MVLEIGRRVMKDEDLSSECLIGGMWFPWSALEMEKQLNFAIDHAAHVNNRSQVYCAHVENGFKSCPMKWKKDRLTKYIQDLKPLKINKNSVIDRIRR